MAGCAPPPRGSRLGSRRWRRWRSVSPIGPGRSAARSTRRLRAAALAATVRRKHRPIRRRQSSSCEGRWPTGAPALFRLAPYSSSAPNISASSTRAASRSGETSAARHCEGSAPYSSSIRSAGAAPTLPLVMVSADRRSSDRALTSAPASSRTRIVSWSGAAHISAVAPALLAALGSAPAVEQPLHERGIAGQGRRHQRRRAARTS